MVIGIVLGLFVAAIVVFATEWIALDVFSLLVLALLAASGVLTPQETFQGLASPAVIMIAGIMLLTGAFVHNGAAVLLARNIRRYAGRSETRVRALLLAAVNALSAIINNVAATAMFIPVAEAMARRFRVDRSRYLMPVAFASMTGGMCTLIGTSTNVAVAGMLQQFGLAPLGLFELTPLGLLVVIAAIPYLLFAAPRLLGARDGEAAAAYGLRDYLYEIVVQDDAALVGRAISRLPGDLDLNILAIVRGERRIVPPHPEDIILAGDLLLVEGQADSLPEIGRIRGLAIRHLPERDLEGLAAAPFRVMEATVSYNSPFIGRTLQELNFRRRYDLSVLAVHRRGEVVVEKVGKIPLRAGDVLLIHGRAERFDDLPHEPTRLLMEPLSFPPRARGKALVATAILLAAIVAGATGLLDVPTAFLAGGAIVLAFGCIPADVAGDYVNIRFLLMVGAMSSLATAMERSGAAALLADGLLSLAGSSDPRILLAVLFLLTALLTQPLSNAAAALLVLPIGIHAAEQIGVDPRSMAIGVTIAASCSFITPFEPACLLVYATGHYRFRDFVRFGTPLTLIALAITLAVVPWLWPFHP